MDPRVIQSIVVVLFLSVSCVHAPVNNSTNQTSDLSLQYKNFQGWGFDYENGRVPKSHIANCYFMSSKEYASVFGNSEYLDIDPSDRNNSLFLSGEQSNSILGSSVRFQKNMFISRINPSKHAIDNLDSIMNDWEHYIVNNNSDKFVKNLSNEYKQKDNLCWLKCLQFVGLYTERKNFNDEYFYNNAKNADPLIASFFGGSSLLGIKNTPNMLGVEEVPAGLGEILAGFGDSSAWKVTNSESIDLIYSLASDSPAIVGQTYRHDNEQYSHVVVVLGAVYSKNTNYYNAVAELTGFFNIPGIPNHSLLKNTPLVFHNFLVFDPSDASVANVDADEFIRTVDFIAMRSHLYDYYPLDPKNYYNE